ncbi:peroxidase 48-like protein, partial [Trifolium pratense]
GCDASILLEDDDYIDSEKDSPPNGSLKGFDVIETIKSKLEVACPGVVSCADILVLAARDSVALAGGPFYPLYTGRRDGSNSFADIATDELPSPYADLSQIISSFKLRGFDEREMVTLLGAHNIGVIHCKFFENRLYNLSGTNKPDPSMNTEFLNMNHCGYAVKGCVWHSLSGKKQLTDDNHNTTIIIGDSDNDDDGDQRKEITENQIPETETGQSDDNNDDETQRRELIRQNMHADFQRQYIKETAKRYASHIHCVPENKDGDHNVEIVIDDV